MREMINMRTSFVTAAALALLAGPAAARCSQPYAPVIKVNASSTKQDMTNLRNDVASFIAASDLYQSCLLREQGDPARGDANQVEKQRVGREFNTALRTFLSTHPGLER